MGRLEEIWNKYEEIHDRLESIDCDPSKHDDFRNDFEMMFYDLNIKIQHIIEKHDAKSSEQVHPTDASEQGSSNSHNNLKLPALKMSIFSGQYHCWISFSDMFKATIHENENWCGIPPRIHSNMRQISNLVGNLRRRE